MKKYCKNPYLRQRSMEHEVQSVLVQSDYKAASGKVLSADDVDVVIDKIQRVNEKEFDLMYDEFYDNGIDWLLNYLYGDRKHNQLSVGDHWEEMSGWDIRVMSDENAIF